MKFKVSNFDLIDAFSRRADGRNFSHIFLLDKLQKDISRYVKIKTTNNMLYDYIRTCYSFKQYDMIENENSKIESSCKTQTSIN